MTIDDRDMLDPERDEVSRSLPSQDLSAGPGGSRRTTGRRRRVRRRMPLWAETGLLLLGTLLVSVLLKTFVVQVFFIPSASMEPGLMVGDRIMVNKLAGDPQRGDVVVFEDPGGWLTEPDDPGAIASVLGKIGLYPTTGHLVKRVIGVAGDTIECCDDQGRLLLNGQPLDEAVYSWADDGRTCQGQMRGCDWKAGPVPEGSLFVMGDNRRNTKDSTAFICLPDQVRQGDCDDRGAYVDESLVVGKVWAVVWPLDHWQRLERPDTFAPFD